MILIIPSSNPIPNKHTHYQSLLITNPISLRIPILIPSPYESHPSITVIKRALGILITSSFFGSIDKRNYFTSDVKINPNNLINTRYKLIKG
ncbi:hypothetical protein RHMOL_Rhmol06G0155000 [Rhododendron molle]|uniref:Uncharacterized protein n=1 Tax=Rhododendron molle TaxID=49168 RepID=A0ACC0NEN9_RHOML|nr:hypothetical protein RHMOL_Rhmol06G0155000 [Rhododendron molle]